MSNRYTYSVPFTADELHADYVIAGMTQTEVAAKWGVSQKVVWRALLKAEIASRKAAPRNQRLERNANWKGGRHIQAVTPRRSAYGDRGYVMIYRPSIPMLALLGMSLNILRLRWRRMVWSDCPKGTASITSISRKTTTNRPILRFAIIPNTNFTTPS